MSVITVQSGGGTDSANELTSPLKRTRDREERGEKREEREEREAKQVRASSPHSNVP